MEDARVRLIVTHGPNLGHEYYLAGDEASIGRSTSNEIVLPSPEISRKHARLWQAGESTYLEDLGSTNGTFVNNTRLTGPATLYDGDEIQIGDSFRFLYASPESATRPISLAATAEVQEGRPAEAVQSRPDASLAGPASEIPTPKPPLYIDDHDLFTDQPDEGQERRYLRRLGCASLLLVAACFLAALVLDSYQGGRLLYCGSLNPFFQVVLGPFGFSPICP